MLYLLPSGFPLSITEEQRSQQKEEVPLPKESGEKRYHIGIPHVAHSCGVAFGSTGIADRPIARTPITMNPSTTIKTNATTDSFFSTFPLPPFLKIRELSGKWMTSHPNTKKPSSSLTKLNSEKIGFVHDEQGRGLFATAFAARPLRGTTLI